MDTKQYIVFNETQGSFLKDKYDDDNPAICSSFGECQITIENIDFEDLDDEFIIYELVEVATAKTTKKIEIQEKTVATVTRKK